jgi:hypothetical protein
MKAVTDALMITGWVGVFFLIPMVLFTISIYFSKRYGKRHRED